MGIFATIKNFGTLFNSQVGNTQTQNRYLTVGGVTIGRQTAQNYKFDPKDLLQATRDEVVQRCCQLIISSTVQGGLKIKTKSDQDKEIIERLLERCNFENNTIFSLNSILSSGGDVIAYFYKENNGGILLNLESCFWNGQRRLAYTIDPIYKKIVGDITITNSFRQDFQKIDSTKCFTLSSNNLSNDYLGETPLMIVCDKVLEKQAITSMGRTQALSNGRLEGIFSPKQELLKDTDPNNKLSALTMMEATVETLIQEGTTFGNYKVTSMPLDFLKVQATSKDLEHNARIKTINYAICTSFGVPPSLVQFDPDNDPNLSNAEQYTDNFAKLTVNNYKTKIEQFWTSVVKAVLPDIEFSLHLSREETDESISIREQFRKSIDDCLKLRELGINAKPNTKGLEMLGIIIDNQENQETSIVDSMDSHNKYLTITKDAQKPKKKIQWKNKTIAIQYSIGDTRHSKKMPCMYGYIEKHKGEDGMALDVYVGVNINSNMIWKIKQILPTGEFDEWKFMLGFQSLQEAKDTYLKLIPKKYFGGIYMSTISEIDRYRVLETVKPDESAIEKVIDPSPPNFDNLYNSKNYKQFKVVIHDNLKSQLDKLFQNLTKFSRYSDDKFYQEILKNLPTIKMSENDLVLEIKNKLIPNLLEQYNQFYNSSFNIDNLPDAIIEVVKDISKLTLTGNNTYKGINETTATALTSSLAKILNKDNLDLDSYSDLTDTQKKQVYNELKTNGRNIILQTRTDLISEMLANNSFNQAYSKLAEVEGSTFVGVKTVGDKNVRPDHKLNEEKYFSTSTKQPWLDPLCRCTYVFADEQTLINQNYKKL